MSWVAKYMAVPYRDGGRDMKGLDCWGLYRLAVLERLGVRLPEWDTVPALDRSAVAETVAEQIVAGGWFETGAPRECDLVLMRYRGEPVHVGCWLEGARIMHTQQNVGVVVLPAAYRSFDGRIVGVFRHETFG